MVCLASLPTPHTGATTLLPAIIPATVVHWRDKSWCRLARVQHTRTIEVPGTVKTLQLLRFETQNQNHQQRA